MSPFEELDLNNYNGMAKPNKQVISFTVTLTSLVLLGSVEGSDKVSEFIGQIF